MSLLQHLPRPRPYACNQCLRKLRVLPRGERTKAKWAGEETDHRARASEWEAKAGRIRSKAQQSMLSVLEERGFVKDVAGGREALDWLLTNKRIGAYVGVDPTAPSLHVGHLLPLMALYWMYIYGFNAVTLLGGGTVQIGDPSGRTTARTRQGADVQTMNIRSIQRQLDKLWVHVKALGIKYQYPENVSRRNILLNNRDWLQNLNAVELMRDLGSGMRLGTMLNRDSVKLRMENGDGMSISEFSYPLFQAYDWWHMYSNHGVQLQLGGSDQYGNICAGMDAVNHMRKLYQSSNHAEGEEHTATATFGVTTPLLTTASGEKFGKSAGNAVWLDKQMMNSFDLYQYFLRTADDDVERYLKLFTFLPINQINLVMSQQRKDESRRTAQHILAKELVELAHGAAEAKKAETAHKEAFSHGTNTFSLGALRNTLSEISGRDTIKVEPLSEAELQLLEYKKAYAATSTSQTTAGAAQDGSKSGASNVVTLPITLFSAGSFPRILYAAGLASSGSEARRLIAKKGAYIVVPNSGSIENPTALKWEHIPTAVKETDPNHYLIDWEAIVLRSGKTKIQICRIVEEERFEAEGLTCPGWEEFKAKRAEAALKQEQ